MARFSVGGGEGTSNPSRKRLKIIRTASRATGPECGEQGVHRSPRDPEEEEELGYGEDGNSEIPEEEDGDEDSDPRTDTEGETSSYDQRSPSYRRRSYSDSWHGRSGDREDVRYNDDRAVSSRRNSSKGLCGCSSSGNNSRDPRGSTPDGSVSMTLLDPEVFDCSICYEPLTTPIYQCDNGHIACSACCTKLMNKCPSCSLPIGYNRCRALEKVLESVRLPCKYAKYGCPETFGYVAKKEGSHERKCVHTPCSCPFPDCKFVGCSEQLYKHVNRKHRSRAKKFPYGATISLTIRSSSQSFVLQEEKDGVLFVVDLEGADVGASVAVGCIAHPGMRAFPYRLTVENERSRIKFESRTNIIQKKRPSEAMQRFAVIPSELLDFDGHVMMDLRIRSNRAGEE